MIFSSDLHIVLSFRYWVSVFSYSAWIIGQTTTFWDFWIPLEENSSLYSWFFCLHWCLSRVRPHWLLTSIIVSIFIVTSTWRCHMDSLLADSLSCWSRLLRGFYRAVLSILCFWHFALLSNELHSVLSQYSPTLCGLLDRGSNFWIPLKVEFLSMQPVFLLILIFSRVKPHCWLTYIIVAIFSVIPTWWCHMGLLPFTLSAAEDFILSLLPLFYLSEAIFSNDLHT